MAPIYLIDTDICIYARQKRPAVLRHFAAVRLGDVAISVISYGELLHGAAKSVNPQLALTKIKSLMSVAPPVPLPEQAGEYFGAIRAELERRGEMIGLHDLWIASHALAMGLTLVTNNEREFRRVKGLKVENWTA
jgi:tRNA(fMet)-specific endonuclease VapC